LRQGLLDQAERDRRLGLENDVGNSSLLAARRVLDPFLGQVEAIADRQAGVRIGERKRHDEIRLISSPARRLRTGGAIFESVLSHFKGLRRHFRVAVSRNVRRASPEAAVDFAQSRFCFATGGETSKSERIHFVKRNSK
jgi:hypothetical protein